MKKLYQFLALAALALAVPGLQAADPSNQARGAAATSNRPLYGGANVSALTDGNRGNTIHGNTDIESGFAYEVNLGIPVKIEAIDIYARQDGCCPERLTNYRVSVHKDNNGSIGDQVWAADRFTDFSNPGSAAGAMDHLTRDLDAAGLFEGQWVRILSLEEPVQNYALQMTEVEVIGTGPLDVSIVQQPQDLVAGPGRPATLTTGVSVRNGDPALLTYQWQRDGVNIAGATEASYTTPPLGSSDKGAKFKAIITYPGIADLTTREAVITDLNYALGAKAYTNRPLWGPGGWNISMLVDGNRAGVFHGDTDIAPGFAYEIDLGTSIKFDRIDLYPRQDGCCPERLTNYRLSIHKDNAGQIGDQVWSTDLHTDGSNSGSAPGAKDAIIPADLNAGGLSEGQWIRILSLEDPVQNYALQMNELEVFGNPSAGTKLILTSEPADIVSGPGKTATLVVAANVFNGDLTQIKYQWQKNGVNIPGATEATYVTPPLATADEGAKFRAVVSYPGLPDLNSREAVVQRLNWAFNAPATTNRPLWVPGGWNISMLVDGNRNGVFHGDTDIEPGFAYEVNLGTLVKMDRIDIFGRQDGCCPERLTNYRVSIHTDNNGQIGDAVWTVDLHTDGTNTGEAPGKIDSLTASLDAAGKFEGNWIRILSLEDPVQNYALQMTELEVYGSGTIVAPPRVSIAKSGAQIELTWNTGALESATQINGPWTAVAGAVSPRKVDTTGNQQFFRLR